jgi:hypothetical protein
MPVTKLESSEARNTAAFATSSGSPMRPIGIVAGILAMASWGCRSTSGVLMTLTLATEPMRMIDAPRSSALGLFAPRKNVLFTLRSNSLSKCSSVRFARERIRRRRHWRPGHQSFPSPSRSRRADRGLAVLRRPLERLRRCCRLPFTASSSSGAASRTSARAALAQSTSFCAAFSWGFTSVGRKDPSGDECANIISANFGHRSGRA